MTENFDFKLRNLCGMDIFPLANILSKCGISRIKDCFINAASSDNNFRSVGISIAFDIIGIICENISDCRCELLEFLSSMSSVPVGELENMPPVYIVRILKAIIKQENFSDFFTELSELFFRIR